MKKTKYFVSERQDPSLLLKAITEVEVLRDNFIEKNHDKIGEIEKEQVQVVATTHTQYIQVILSLTYYPKP